MHLGAYPTWLGACTVRSFLVGTGWEPYLLLLIPGFNETSLIDISEHSGKVQTQLKALERIQGTGLGFFTALC